MNKKSEASRVFIIFITLVVIVMILFFGAYAVKKVISTMGQTEMAIFADEIEKDIQIMSIKKGTKILEYDLPSKVHTVVLIDPIYKKVLIQDPFIQKNPIIKDMLESGGKENMFLFTKNGKLLKAFYIGEIMLGKFEDQACTGLGTITTSLGKLELRMTKSGSSDVFLGDQCTDKKSIFFQPFDADFGYPARAEYIEDGKKIKIKENIIEDQLFSNATFISSEFAFDDSKILDRIYYKAEIPDNTTIQIRLGFIEASGTVIWYGSDLFASKGDPGYYYTDPGQYAIASPTLSYESIKFNVTLISNTLLTESPILEWIKLTYKY